MVATTHQLFGVACGLATMYVYERVQHDLPVANAVTTMELSLFIFAVMIGCLLPDLDTPHSKLGRRLRVISLPMRALFGHRGMTHSLFFVGIILFIGYGIMSTWDVSLYFIGGLPIGVLSHIIGDAVTRAGVPLFYPFSSRRFMFPLTMRTGGWMERWLALCLLLVIAWFVVDLLHGWGIIDGWALLPLWR